MKVLLLGIYHYRFIVDGRRTYDPEMPCMHDDVGNVFNILDLKVLLLLFPCVLAWPNCITLSNPYNKLHNISVLGI